MLAIEKEEVREGGGRKDENMGGGGGCDKPPMQCYSGLFTLQCYQRSKHPGTLPNMLHLNILIAILLLQLHITEK